MQTITINVVDKVATAVGNPFIVCGNSDYIILFNFDKAWDGQTTKTARFTFEQDGEEKFIEVPFNGNQCKVPILYEVKKIEVGVYAGDLLSTTRCKINCRASILDGEGAEHEAPDEDIYNQIIEVVNEATTAATEAKAAAEGFEATTRETFANAFKGNLYGEIVTADDVSPVEHHLACKVESKNLYDNIDNYVRGEGVTYTYKNYTLTVTGQYVNKFIPLFEGEKYTFSCTSTRAGSSGGGAFVRAYTADQKTYINLYEGISVLSPKATVTLPKGYPILRITLYGDGSGGGSTSTYTNIMLERGGTATDYISYVDPSTAKVTRYGADENDNSQTYTPNADGTVEGITSLSPNMTLLTDTEGTVINCTYNRDITATLDRIIKMSKAVSQISSVTLSATKWTGAASPYSQVVTIPGTTKNSKIDLNPTVEQLSIFHNKDISFVVGNNNGTITVYCIGQKPTNDYTMQVTITEVATNG